MSAFINDKVKELRKLRLHSHQPKRTPPGAMPGSITIPEGAQQPRIKIFSYSDSFFEEVLINGIEELKTHVEKSKHLINWIDIQGIGDKKLLEDIADYFSIHRLQLEDVVNTYQRPKYEEFEDYLFIVSRMLERNDVRAIINEQMSFFVGKNYLISIQEFYEDMLDPVRERIRKGKGYLRSRGSDYLVYALMDTITDHYFPILVKMGDRLDDLEEELLRRPTRASMFRIQRIKRELILLRRVIWPERDKINELLRGHSPFITEDTKMYLRDVYDHCIQLLDIVESYREVTTSTMDMYLSSVSNKMNQIMKVLTIISTIFIPLTFIVGVYGMNFAHQDAVSGKALPFNMPELYSPYGYVTVLVFMVLVTVIQLVIFYKKGWLGRRSKEI